MAGIRKSKPVSKRENRSGRTELDVSTGESGFKVDSSFRFVREPSSRSSGVASRPKSDQVITDFC